MWLVASTSHSREQIFINPVYNIIFSFKFMRNKQNKKYELFYYNLKSGTTIYISNIHRGNYEIDKMSYGIDAY